MSYYSEKLSAEKLKKCYDLAPERVKQYLEAEINHVLQKVQPSDIVLELGCGYGRVLPAIASKAKQVTGIDTSLSSIEYGQRFTNPVRNCTMVQMDAAGLPDNADCEIHEDYIMWHHWADVSDKVKKDIASLDEIAQQGLFWRELSHAGH